MTTARKKIGEKQATTNNDAWEGTEQFLILVKSKVENSYISALGRHGLAFLYQGWKESSRIKLALIQIGNQVGRNQTVILRFVLR